MHKFQLGIVAITAHKSSTILHLYPSQSYNKHLSIHIGFPELLPGPIDIGEESLTDLED